MYIAKSCQAATILGNPNKNVQDAAYAFGKNLGIAFQVFIKLKNCIAGGSFVRLYCYCRYFWETGEC
jgi:hypothetical protein